jgi:hypothetical protein
MEERTTRPDLQESALIREASGPNTPNAAAPAFESEALKDQTAVDFNAIEPMTCFMA